MPVGSSGRGRLPSSVPTRPRPSGSKSVPALVGLDDLPGAIRVATQSGMTTVHTHDLQSTLHALLGQAARCDVRLSNLEARNASLESVFLAIASGDNDPDESASSMEAATR